MTNAEAPGKRVTVALALRDLEELEDEHDLDNQIFRLFGETYRTIFQSDPLVCIAMVNLHAEFFEDRGGYRELSVLGPVFGASMTRRQAEFLLSEGFDEYWVQQTLTREFVRDQFRTEFEFRYGDIPDWLLMQPPDKDPSRKVHPCHADD